MERCTKFIELSLGQVRDAAAECGLRRHVVAAAPVQGGRANTLYRLQCNGAEYVLRLYARDAAACAKEVALHRQLAALVPLAPLVGFHAESLPGLGVPAAVFGFVEGETLDRILAAGETKRAFTLAAPIGRAMAAIATMTFAMRGDLVAGAQGELAVRPWDFGGKSFIRACVEDTPAGKRMGAVLAHQLLEFEATCEERWSSTGGALLVHGDFNPSNILVHGGQVAAILDWEFAHAGDPMMDMGNLLRRREGAELPAGFDTALAEGYASGAALPTDWRRRAEYIDLSSACEFLSSREDRPMVHAAALRQITETLARYAWPARPSP